MADPVTLTTSDLRAIVPPDELRRGTELADKGALQHLARYENRIFCEAKGSDPTPYKVSIELAKTLAEMKIRCACWASRGRPICKHAAALLVQWARAPGSFAVSDAPPAGATSGEGKKKAVKKGKTEAADLMKRGVEQVVTLVRELLAAGVASLAGDRAEQVRSLGANLREHGLRRLSARTLDLAALLGRAGQQGGIPSGPYVELLADMLLTARKLEKHAGGEALEEKHVEELVGKTWGKNDREPVQGLALLEYASRGWETPDGFEVNENRLLDLVSGAHYSEKQIIPKFMAKRTEPLQSRGARILRGARGGAYPGYAPTRLALEDTGAHEDLLPRGVEEMLSKALPGVGAALAAFQEHRRDIFAPARFPVAFAADALLVTGDRPRLLDAQGDAIAVAAGSGIGEVLDRARLKAVLGDIEVEAAFPVFHPLAAIIEGKRGLELRRVLGRQDPTREAKAAAALERLAAGGAAWAEAARAAGASEAAIALHEVRDELASLLAAGLAAITARAVEPLCERLGELTLQKPAALLGSLPGKPEAERMDDAVKVHQVLGVALVRLASAARVGREGLVSVPGAPGVLVREPAKALSPQEASRAVALGRLHAFEAALHYARWFESAPAEELLASPLPAWANGAVASHIVRTLAPQGATAAHAAERVVEGRYGRAAKLTAVRLLEEMGGGDARRLLARFAGMKGQEWLAVRVRSAEALRAPGAADAATAAKARTVEEAIAQQARRLESAGRADDRRDAAQVLFAIAAAATLPHLRRAAKEDASRQVRDDATSALGLLGDVESVPWLVTALAARGTDDEGAKRALEALGEIGDSRGAAEVVAAFAEGYRPPVAGAALEALELVVLEPLADALERDPSIGTRKAVETAADRLPEIELAKFIVERMDRAKALEDFPERAQALLKLAGSRDPVRRAAAGALLKLIPEPTTGAQKAAVKAAKRMTAEKKEKEAKAEKAKP